MTVFTVDSILALKRHTLDQGTKIIFKTCFMQFFPLSRLNPTLFNERTAFNNYFGILSLRGSYDLYCPLLDPFV